MAGRTPVAAEWRFLLSSDDETLLRAILPADSVARARRPIRWKLWLSLTLPPLLAAAGAILFHFHILP